MNLLVKKEIRLLLPSWIAAIFLAIAPAATLSMLQASLAQRFVGDSMMPMWVDLFLLLGTIFLGIGSFGQEFSFKTFSSLLVLPVPRSRIWFIKTSVLAIAFLSTLLAAMAAWAVYFHLRPAPRLNYSIFLFGNFSLVWLGIMALFSGSLWTTLLLRQVSGAFWLTLLIPGATATFVYQIMDHYPGREPVANRVIVILLVPYAVAGFFWARHLFFRAQDLQWAGGNVLLPWRRNIRRQSSSLVIGRFRNRYLALIWKEIQLHEASLFIAGALCALQLMLIPLRLLVYEPTLRMAFDNYWSLWLLMPLIIGSTAVADERRGGTLEAQLCLPVPRSTQFSIKFLVGLALSLVLGAAAPSIIEHTRRFGMNDWLPYWIFPAAGGIFFISFYGSTLARTTLQALGMAIGIPVAVGVGIATFVDVASHDYSRGENIRWVGLALLIGMPILPFLLARLMFWNFRWLHQDWKMWRRNAAIILSFFVLLIVGANAIHYRAWEYLTSQDEPHGPARLAPGQSVVVSGMGSTITAILPDGHCWLGSLSYEESFFFDDFATYKGANAHFAGGSNWISIIHGWTGIVGIRSDGSLWHAKMIWPRRTEATVNEFERIGTDRDWSQAAGVGSVFGFLLLKTDGSLWLWGTNSGNSFAVRQRLNDQMPPVRLGDKTNWTQLFTLESHAGAKNKKGERYVWDVRRGDTGDPFQFYPLPKQNFPWQPFNTKAVAVTTNGSLWVALGMEKDYDFIPDKKVQLAPESKWKAASFDYWNQSVIALRQDGTLWKSSSLWSPVDLPEKIAMTQLDHHSDWVSLSPGWLGVAVAADGSVWSWCLPGSLFLAPSRKPIRIGNIFEETPAKH